MAEISPFRGLYFDSSKVPDLNKVITPPYDVIELEQQEEFFRRSPYNMIHLILGMHCSLDDPDAEEQYDQAGRLFKQWLEEGVLRRDPVPAIYPYEIEYKLSPSLSKKRKGFICLLKLEEFATGCVRPHEKTYETTKSERLKLMCCCNANLSQIFALYSDPADVVMHYLEQGREADPMIDFEDETGIKHKIWRTTDKAILRKVHSLMRDKSIFIADGHHRYETALNYMRMMREKYPDRGEKASFNYVMVYLANLNHSGVSILPTHRMLTEFSDFDLNGFLQKAKEYFEIDEYPFDTSNKTAVLDDFLKELKSHEKKGGAFGFYVRGVNKFFLLRGNRELIKSYLANKKFPEAMQSLDVVILTHLILKDLLQISDDFLNNEKKMWYEHDAYKAISLVDSGQYKMTFLINPTRIDQVQAIASAGLIMPHKATYFYPKVITGTIINLIDPDEDVDF